MGEELYEKILQARAKAAKEQQMKLAAAAAAEVSAASTPSTAAVTDRPVPSEPDEDNYKTLPCSNKMKQSSEEGSVACYYRLTCCSWGRGSQPFTVYVFLFQIKSVLDNLI